MWRGIVNKDDSSGEGESAGNDLDEENAAEEEPDEGAGRLSRGRSGGGDEGEVRSEGVGDGEEEEGVAEGGDGSEPGVDAGVDEELEGYSYEAEDCHCEADGAGGHAETACKGEGEGLMGVGGGGGEGRVEAWGGEVDEPEVVEDADVHGEDEVAEEGAEDVGGPDAVKGEFVFGFWFGFGQGGFEFVAVGAGGGEGRVDGVAAGDGGVLVSARAEEAGYGATEADAEVSFVTEGV